MCCPALEILTCNCLKWQPVHFTTADRLLAVMTTSSFGSIFSALYADVLPDPTINHSPSYLALGCEDWRDDIERRMRPLCQSAARLIVTDRQWIEQVARELRVFSVSALIKCLLICSEVYWFSAYLISLWLISQNLPKSSLIKCYLLNVLHLHFFSYWHMRSENWLGFAQGVVETLKLLWNKPGQFDMLLPLRKCLYFESITYFCPQF